MTADARMIFVECPGSGSVSVPKVELQTWLGHLPGYERRTWTRSAQVGGPILSTITTVSQHEACVATAAARAEAARGAGAGDADMLRYCDLIEPLIGTIDPVAYYSSWVIVETADID